MKSLRVVSIIIFVLIFCSFLSSLTQSGDHAAAIIVYSTILVVAVILFAISFKKEKKKHNNSDKKTNANNEKGFTSSNGNNFTSDLSNNNPKSNDYVSTKIELMAKDFDTFIDKNYVQKHKIILPFDPFIIDPNLNIYKKFDAEIKEKRIQVDTIREIIDMIKKHISFDYKAYAIIVVYSDNEKYSGMTDGVYNVVFNCKKGTNVENAIYTLAHEVSHMFQEKYGIYSGKDVEEFTDALTIYFGFEKYMRSGKHVKISDSSEVNIGYLNEESIRRIAFYSFQRGNINSIRDEINEDKKAEQEEILKKKILAKEKSEKDKEIENIRNNLDKFPQVFDNYLKHSNEMVESLKRVQLELSDFSKLNEIVTNLDKVNSFDYNEKVMFIYNSSDYDEIMKAYKVLNSNLYNVMLLCNQLSDFMKK